MRHRLALLAALGLLALSAVLAVLSLWGDSSIVDEATHLPAGYSYITQGDMRLNPEHPPLLKDLAGLSVLLWSKVTHTPIQFPSSSPAWVNETNGQWAFGPEFLYTLNHHPESMLRAGRMPTVILFFAFGAFLFFWVHRRWGDGVALLTTFFYALSPTFLTHARFVTSDVGAAFGFFASVAAFLFWIKRPTGMRLIVFGVVLGLAQLTKFSLVLIVPLFPVLLAIWVTVDASRPSWKEKWKLFWKRILQYAAVVAIAFGLVVTPVYMLHTMHYPVEKQKQDLEVWRGGIEANPVSPFIFWASDKPVLRSFAHYLTGVLLVRNRTLYGSETFFLGNVDSGGRTGYFPLVYLLKEPLALHILTLLALLTAGWAFIRSREKSHHVAEWTRTHFIEISFVLFLLLYWYMSISSALNIGVRHILPTFPFVYILVSKQLVALGKKLRAKSARMFQFGAVGLSGMLVWQAATVLAIHPHYLAYFNELAGGPKGGARYVADSNLDWGQDLNRLAEYVKKNTITSISIDYFGGGSPEYAMPGVAHRVSAQDTPFHGWFAVSQTFLTQEQATGGTHTQKIPQHRYSWLSAYTPVTTIGYSIVVYHLPD